MVEDNLPCQLFPEIQDDGTKEIRCDFHRFCLQYVHHRQQLDPFYPFVSIPQSQGSDVIGVELNLIIGFKQEGIDQNKGQRCMVDRLKP